MSPLTCPLRVNQGQDIIQVDNNTETLAMAVVRAVKTQGLWPAQKVKPSTDKAHCAKQMVRNNNDA